VAPGQPPHGAALGRLGLGAEVAVARSGDGGRQRGVTEAEELSEESPFHRVDALAVSGGLHVLTLGALAALAPIAGLGMFYVAGVVIVGALLTWEHAILKPSDLSRLNMAFFNLNGYVSVAFLAAVVADVALRR